MMKITKTHRFNLKDKNYYGKTPYDMVLNTRKEEVERLKKIIYVNLFDSKKKENLV